MVRDEFLWTEKYRPKKIEDCILPQEMKDTFATLVEQGSIPNMLLCGPPGCGKCLDPEEEIEIMVSDELFDIISKRLT